MWWRTCRIITFIITTGTWNGMFSVTLLLLVTFGAWFAWSCSSRRTFNTLRVTQLILMASATTRYRSGTLQCCRGWGRMVMMFTGICVSSGIILAALNAFFVCWRTRGTGWTLGLTVRGFWGLLFTMLLIRSEGRRIRAGNTFSLGTRTIFTTETAAQLLLFLARWILRVTRSLGIYRAGSAFWLWFMWFVSNHLSGARRLGGRFNVVVFLFTRQRARSGSRTAFYRRCRWSSFSTGFHTRRRWGGMTGSFLGFRSKGATGYFNGYTGVSDFFRYSLFIDGFKWFGVTSL